MKSILHFVQIACRVRLRTRRSRRLAAAAAFLALCHTGWAGNWPNVPLPRDVSKFDIGQEVTLNGMPMRIQGFVSASGVDQMADSFRRLLGQPLVENSFAGKRILGRVQGEHYLSVQIEPAGAGSRGVVAVTELKHAYDSRAATEAGRESLARRLPAGSQLISQLSSVDGGKLSRHLVITNGNGEKANREWIRNMMSEDGFIFERETVVDPQAAADFRSPRSGATQFYKGKGKEAMATISRDANGRTTVVLNIINFVERRQ